MPPFALLADLLNLLASAARLFLHDPPKSRLCAPLARFSAFCFACVQFPSRFSPSIPAEHPYSPSSVTSAPSQTWCTCRRALLARQQHQGLFFSGRLLRDRFFFFRGQFASRMPFFQGLPAPRLLLCHSLTRAFLVRPSACLFLCQPQTLETVSRLPMLSTSPSLWRVARTRTLHILSSSLFLLVSAPHFGCKASGARLPSHREGAARGCLTRYCTCRVSVSRIDHSPFSPFTVPCIPRRFQAFFFRPFPSPTIPTPRTPPPRACLQSAFSLAASLHPVASRALYCTLATPCLSLFPPLSTPSLPSVMVLSAMALHLELSDFQTPATGTFAIVLALHPHCTL